MFAALKVTRECPLVLLMKVKGKGKGIPLQAWEGSWGSRRLRLLDLLDTRHMKVVSSSPLRTGRLYPQEVSGTHF